MDVYHPCLDVSSIGERVLEPGWDEHEGARLSNQILSLDSERELAFEHVEGVVLTLVDMGRRAVGVRSHREEPEVEPGCVLAAGEELDVADAVSLTGTNDDRFHASKDTHWSYSADQSKSDRGLLAGTFAMVQDMPEM